MQEQHYCWLGPLRGLVRKAAILFVSLALLSAGWLIFSGLFLGSEIGMQQMLRPGDLLSVKITLWLLLFALLFSSIYLSDTVGAIEMRPRGFFDIISLICSRLAMLGIGFLVFVMFYEVVARYVFAAPTLWANEFSLWMAGFIFLLAGLYAMQQRSHIRIYVVYDLMPRWLQKTSDCISVLLIWAFAAALVWGSFNEALTKLLRWEAFGTAWNPPIPGTIKPAILITVALVALQALSNLILDWNSEPEHHSPLDEIDEAEIESIRRSLENK